MNESSKAVDENPTASTSPPKRQVDANGFKAQEAERVAAPDAKRCEVGIDEQQKWRTVSCGKGKYYRHD
jgi:hypothetical protein